ncbi:MAG TPA: hypothetical protein VLX91_05885 [Candidatus Acidoferrales bacterium]|nr:hypothetical protein [Candidatus Acidoferrales bacterium]
MGTAMVLIVTNTQKLEDANINEESQIALGLISNNDDILKQNSPLGYEASLGKFVSLKNTHDIILVHENMAQQQIIAHSVFKSLLENADPLVGVVHFAAQDMSTFIESKLRQGKRTDLQLVHHGSDSLPTQLFNVLCDRQISDKKGEILKILKTDFTLEFKLKLLHQLHVPPNNISDAEERWSKLIELVKADERESGNREQYEEAWRSLKKGYQTLKESDEQKYEEKYMELLAVFRNRLNLIRE